ncbi:class I SAM-dependent methyltransferase [Hymenobacter sp. BT186]|uniref:Class I SAM-dependent methyltransferase n=1 Tax=Hymenobacter telluris TaxID=2816474 RepID=A0A939EYU6_9BACT|nr:class I SAM-dependent methyltransferase [Hymenobacter telluris]MBO0360030.1 class I SAM-dependent methyltransferase [Hymenobacter telluris]MBW3376057.1 class I SAM-dependent methyltransferase [Hymenobacter norwichensis]
MRLSLPDSGFDRVAAFYDPLSRLVYGRALVCAQHHALEAGLPPGAPHLLVIGGGTGQVLLEVLRQRPKASVLYLEASPQMLGKARALLAGRLPAAVLQVEFRLGTEASLTSHDAFDALITFFFLDLFEPRRLQQIMARLHASRKPGAPWLLADFAPAQTWWQRWLLAAMYSFFRLTTGISGRTLPPFREELARLGLRAGPARYFFGGMIEASVWR